MTFAGVAGVAGGTAGGGLCSVLYFRGDEILCWPGVGTYARDTGYLRECSLLRGNQAN